MIKKRAFFAAVAIFAMSAAGYADAEQSPSKGHNGNGSVMNGDYPHAMEDHDHVSGTVKSVASDSMPNGQKVYNMEVQTDRGEEMVTHTPKKGEEMSVRTGDRVKAHGRRTMCNGKSMLRCEKLHREGTVNHSDREMSE